MEDILAAARKAGEVAYAPYSGYPVGAAVRSGDRTWTGCNMENASFPAGICAERVAIGKMVSDGVRTVDEIAVCSADGGTPCGICLQTLLEFAADPATLFVHCSNQGGEVVTYSLGELLPHGFGSDSLKRTEP